MLAQASAKAEQFLKRNKEIQLAFLSSSGV